MIELALKTALERLTGLDVYPLLLPDELQEGIIDWPPESPDSWYHLS